MHQIILPAACLTVAVDPEMVCRRMLSLKTMFKYGRLRSSIANARPAAAGTVGHSSDLRGPVMMCSPWSGPGEKGVIAQLWCDTLMLTIQTCKLSSNIADRSKRAAS